MTSTTKPILVQWRGEQRKLVDLCRQYGRNRATVDKRLRMGWTLRQALLTPEDHCRLCFEEGRIRKRK